MVCLASWRVLVKTWEGMGGGWVPPQVAMLLEYAASRKPPCHVTEGELTCTLPRHDGDTHAHGSRVGVTIWRPCANSECAAGCKECRMYVDRMPRKIEVMK